MPGRSVLLAIASLILTSAAVSACTEASRTSRGSSAAYPSAGTITRAAGAECPSVSPMNNTAMGPEVQGTGDGATLYGLLMAAAPPPVRTGEPVKIVWRMTGSGPLRLSTTDPRGRPVPLQWGPELHAGSDYNRPGQEWGAGYRFGTSGCWRLHAQRTSGSADVWLQVAPR